VYRLLVGKPQGKRPLGRHRHRCIHLDQDRYRWKALVNAIMNLRVPQNAGKLQSGCKTCGLSSGMQIHRVS
jgi:hypothetical protein